MTKKAFEKHLACYSQAANILYKFDNKSLVSFEVNYRFLGDLPFVIYFDFETTVVSDLFMDQKMYVISYCMVFAFHPKLKIDRIVIYCSFLQSQEELFGLRHLKQKMLKHSDYVMPNQLKDAELKVHEKKSSFSLSEILSIELKFTIDNLLRWCYIVHKTRFLSLYTITKQKHEKENKIDWLVTKCVICDFKLSVGSSFGPGSDEMTYCDFIFKKERLFLRNVYDAEVLKNYSQIKDLQTYYETFNRVVNCAILIDKY